MIPVQAPGDEVHRLSQEDLNVRVSPTPPTSVYSYKSNSQQNTSDLRLKAVKFILYSIKNGQHPQTSHYYDVFLGHITAGATLWLQKKLCFC